MLYFVVPGRKPHDQSVIYNVVLVTEINRSRLMWFKVREQMAEGSERFSGIWPVCNQKICGPGYNFNAVFKSEALRYLTAHRGNDGL